MFSFLKKHPFAVEAFFTSSIVLTFAVKKEEIENRIPECLELDTFNEQWAFIAIAMVQTKNLRPKGFPSFTGNDFFLTGYRIFVNYTDKRGKRLRGLYIIKSETDKKKMEWLGNIFTQYKYTTNDFVQSNHGDKHMISSASSAFNVLVNEGGHNVTLPATSPFTDWKDARRFAGPLPFTFSYDREKNEVLIIEGVREDWKPQPVIVEEYNIPFLQTLGLKEFVLANGFIIKNIPYYWKKGRIEKWEK